MMQMYQKMMKIKNDKRRQNKIVKGFEGTKNKLNGKVETAVRKFFGIIAGDTQIMYIKNIGKNH